VTAAPLTRCTIPRSTPPAERVPRARGAVGLDVDPDNAPALLAEASLGYRVTDHHLVKPLP
jgi:hypothetical protein